MLRKKLTGVFEHLRLTSISTVGARSPETHIREAYVCCTSANHKRFDFRAPRLCFPLPAVPRTEKDSYPPGQAQQLHQYDLQDRAEISPEVAYFQSGHSPVTEAPKASVEGTSSRKTEDQSRASSTTSSYQSKHQERQCWRRKHADYAS